MRKAIVRYYQKTDKFLWLLCFLAAGISLVLLYGILQSGYNAYLDISNRNLLVQAAAFGLGAVGAVVISLIDYNFVKKLWYLHSAAVYGLVLLTFFIGVGVAERADDKRWLVIPLININLQPAELLKLSFILTFALHISKLEENLNRLSSILTLVAHAAIPVLLIHFQGDDGSALLIAGIAVTMLFFAGIRWYYIAGAAAMAAVATPFLWMYVINDFQKTRILTLIHQATADPLGDYYQQYQAKVAIAMGGATGVGLTNTKHIYVPEMHNDFIFSFLCESFGLMGALGVLLLMTAICLKLLYNSSLADDKYGACVCVGVFAMFAFQIIINIGMNLSLLPVIGNTFPFLSYGGTSAATSFLAFGLALSIYMRRKSDLFFD
ncbi:FtsW/RodA/SpoVE family cell cycle protein [Ruminococcaceae bacterium OttesenSCG-928-L11]|nr:FtsW/RodA/SpoVE family cell cycle protein [Ruminococcaceae bacterium OttesenSCG-928-L11]